MLYLVKHWPQYSNSKYWPQAIDYSVRVFNRFPNIDSGTSLNEIWFNALSPGCKLLRAHVLGCQFMCLMPLLRMKRKYQNGTLGRVSASSLDSLIYTPLKFFWS
jgi:hypothetical protein